MAIVGFGLATVTFGASIGLSVGGIALAVAGGSTAAGASIVDTAIEKSNVKHAQEQLARDYDDLNLISAIAKEIQEKIDDVRQQCPNISTAKVFGEGIFRTSTTGMRLGTIALNTLKIGTVALRLGSIASKSDAIAGSVLNFVLIPIDLAEIARSSYSLKNESQTKAIEKLNGIVEQLEQQKQAITELLQEQTQATATFCTGSESGLN